MIDGMIVLYIVAAICLAALVHTATQERVSMARFFTLGIVLLFVAVVIGLHFVFAALQDHGLIDHYSVPLTVEQAREAGCPIALPPEARNVQFGIAVTNDKTENVVRYEAPVAVCRAQMPKIIRTKEGKSPILGKLRGPPERLDSPLDNSDWFDIDRIVHGETASFENALGRVWIDTDRGIFYFHQEKE